MNRNTIISILQAHKEELHQRGMTHLFLFGSFAQDSAHTASDVDLFFDYDNLKLNLFDIMAMKDRIEAMLEIKTDLMTRNSLHPALRAQIEAHAVPVF